ncbi:hypothetical protein ABGB18_25175 [Nonomuraea sp. B12E4]|uniref:FAD-dependent oxidoreductase n=1 Tax=Nonomuraea sp. B12E4 TaxID=3153564 RepID=UPI00325C6DD0
MGVTVEWETRLVGLRPGEHGVGVDLVRDGSRLSCETRWLVGADGAHSTVPPGTRGRPCWTATTPSAGPWPRPWSTRPRPPRGWPPPAR